MAVTLRRGRKKEPPSPKGSFVIASAELGEETRNVKNGPPRGDSEDQEVKRKKRLKQALVGSDFAEQEKRKEKRCKRAPLNPTSHWDGVDQVDTKLGRVVLQRIHTSHALGPLPLPWPDLGHW